MKVKYSEIFTSFQGEAGFAGMPTIWVRFFGCNLECNGFGQKNPMDESTYILPYKNIDVSEYEKLEDLPVFEYGCDSSYSWSKKFSSLAHTDTVEELVDKLISLGEKNLGLSLKGKHRGFWYHPVTNQPIQLCFTGGEPLLWQRQIKAICDEFAKRDIPPIQITIETNGTKHFTIFDSLTQHSYVFISASPKLYSVTGEKDAVKIDVLKSYFETTSGWLKFVVNGTEECWEELDEHLRNLQPIPCEWDIWVMPVGSTKEQQEGSTIAKIATAALQRGYKIATRNHVFVFGNVIGS